MSVDIVEDIVVVLCGIGKEIGKLVIFMGFDDVVDVKCVNIVVGFVLKGVGGFFIYYFGQIVVVYGIDVVVFFYGQYIGIDSVIGKVDFIGGF